MNLGRNQGKAKWRQLGRRLLLIDSMGAAVSLAFLAGLLPAIQPEIGMSLAGLHWLSLPPAVFAAYSLGSYLFGGRHWRKLLRGIAAGNAGYCCLSVGFMVAECGNLTGLGWGYFIGEVGVVAALAVVEWKNAGGV